MRRSPWSRVIALLTGLWFVAVTAAPEVTHACPTHGSHAAALGVDHGNHAASQAQVADANHHSASPSGSGRSRGKQCSCLGSCCSTAPVAVVSASVALADLVTVATRDGGLPDYAYVPVAARHVLPLAHAPPLGA